jgi:hypothetical protein
LGELSANEAHQLLDEALESAKRLAPFIAQKKKKKQGV